MKFLLNFKLKIKTEDLKCFLKLYKLLYLGINKKINEEEKMKEVILLRYGEIHLKGRNRKFFEDLLIDKIKKSLKDIKCSLKQISGRYLITDFAETKKLEIIEKVKNVFGLISLSLAWEIKTSKEEIENMSLVYFEKLNEKKDLKNLTFKVSVNRADKKFPMHSDEFGAHLGGIILEKFKELKVDLSKPEIELIVDIRENGSTYILTEKINCKGGMPVGSAGQGLLMLSGGIDSPVAGYLMAKRGLRINAVHFFSFPYTSLQAKDKVIKLAKILSQYTYNIKMFMVPFTKIQEQIHSSCGENYMITVMRRIMFRIAEKICKQNNFDAIITGENLGQVASQTIESITVFNNVVKEKPVLRPVISFDKYEIINIAREIGTFETSILPYEDCCTVFLPKNPIIRPKLDNVLKQENYLNIDELVDDAVQNTEVVLIDY